MKLLNEFPKAFFGLTFNAGETELKIKAKAPKSGKPKTAKVKDPSQISVRLLQQMKK